VALLDTQGRPVWSEPKDALKGSVALGGRDWFQKVLALQHPVVNAIAPHDGTLVVAAPILRHGHITGVLVGLLDGGNQLLPGSEAVSEGLQLVVLNREGDVFIPRAPPEWTRGAAFLPTVESLVTGGRAETVTLGKSTRAMAATGVGETGLRLALVADEAEVIAPIRRSFLGELLFLAVLQTLTVLLFAVYLRRTYRAFMRLEVSASQQEKMVALGSAASLIAHEVKNSLNGLKAAASLLESGEPPALPVRSMRGQIDRLGHLASSLLHFGKPANAQRVPAELNHLVRDALEGLKSLPEADDALITTDFGAPVHVQCDPLLLITALDNLIRNAIEAAVVAKDLGRVVEPRVLVRVGPGAQGWARIQVEDNAGGPPEDFEVTLFQPFVTSKPKGIGLGLSMARQALEQQGATLGFERTAQGSRFTVELAREEA
jgi:signal transduction histidine kinase